jgi:hypothetical protein
MVVLGKELFLECKVSLYDVTERLFERLVAHHP